MVQTCVSQRPNDQTTKRPGTFAPRNTHYHPTDTFRIRVLGEFPRSEDEALIPLAWIEAAQSRELQATGAKHLAVDVARFGSDWTIIGLRQGPVLLKLWPCKGLDTMQVADRVEYLAYAEHPESIAIDVVGPGAGVVDRLIQKEIAGIEPINSCHAAIDREQFANRRAELYFGLRERFFEGNITIPNDPLLVEELSAIRYIVTAGGRKQIESKEEIKRRLGRSPDRADMLAMLFNNAGIDEDTGKPPRPSRPSPAESLRAEMRDW